MYGCGMWQAQENHFSALQVAGIKVMEGGDQTVTGNVAEGVGSSLVEDEVVQRCTRSR